MQKVLLRGLLSYLKNSMEWRNPVLFHRTLNYRRYGNEEYHRAHPNHVLEAEAIVQEAPRDPVDQAQDLEADREVETDLAE